MPTGKKARGHTWEWSVLSLGGFNYACILPCIDSILYHMIKFPNGSVTSDSKSWMWWLLPCLHSSTYFTYIPISAAMPCLMGHLDRCTGFPTLGALCMHIQAVSDVFCEFRIISSNKGSPLAVAPPHLGDNLFMAGRERKPCVILSPEELSLKLLQKKNSVLLLGSWYDRLDDCQWKNFSEGPRSGVWPLGCAN